MLCKKAYLLGREKARKKIIVRKRRERNREREIAREEERERGRTFIMIRNPSFAQPLSSTKTLTGNEG